MAGVDPTALTQKLEKVKESRDKEEMEGEGSHSSFFNLHGAQGSSVPDREDLTKEDRFLIYHAFLFPVNFGFPKEDLIRLWIAEGLFQIHQSPTDRVEDDASAKFDSFLQRGLIVPTTPDPGTNYHNNYIQRWLYTLHESVESSFGPSISEGAYLRISDGNFRDLVPKLTTHLSILCQGEDDRMFGAIKEYDHLKSLFILPGPGRSLSSVPNPLFKGFANLTTLKLRSNHLYELPSSILHLISLRYIDISHTPITSLPDAIDKLTELQTIKLTDCFNLHGLPDGMRKLTNLRHLDLDVARQLRSMPPGIGDLIHLQTLLAFLIGNEEGCQIRELRNLTNITGPFCIWGLQNVVDLEDVMEAALIDKNYITALELRWTGEKAENSPDDEEILEHLKPVLQLQKLSILYYSGLKLPTWIGDRSYEWLVDLSLCSFTNCRFLPSLGNLPSLRLLDIQKMNELERIDRLFYRNGSENSQDHAFPSLEIVFFQDMPKWEDWSGVQSGDFPSLENLHLINCPKLKSLPYVSCMRKSLKSLQLNSCQSIMPFLDGEETVPLDFLCIYGCPELKRCFDKSTGQDWPKIARVPTIVMDD